MALIIKNRGRRPIVIELGPEHLKVAQVVRTSERSKETGRKRVIEKRRVFGGSLTVFGGQEASMLPNLQPIPDEVARMEAVRSNPDLEVRVIPDADWRKQHVKGREKARAPRAAVAEADEADELVEPGVDPDAEPAGKRSKGGKKN